MRQTLTFKYACSSSCNQGKKEQRQQESLFSSPETALRISEQEDKDLKNEHTLCLSSQKVRLRSILRGSAYTNVSIDGAES